MAKIVIDRQGDKRYYNDHGRYHRTDGPAIICKNGSFVSYTNGKRNGFSRNEAGEMFYWIDQEITNPTGPSWDFPNGHKVWWKDNDEQWPEFT